MYCPLHARPNVIAMNHLRRPAPASSSACARACPHPRHRTIRLTCRCRSPPLPGRSTAPQSAVSLPQDRCAERPWIVSPRRGTLHRTIDYIPHSPLPAIGTRHAGVGNNDGGQARNMPGRPNMCERPARVECVGVIGRHGGGGVRSHRSSADV